MKYLASLGLLTTLVAGPATAQSVQITGFGQMVAGTVSDGESHPGVDYDDDWSFKDESLFALQIRGDIDEQWSATAQIVAEGRNDYDPDFAWAYVAWNGGNGWSAKAGRQRVPFYRYSDYLQVGQAYPWLRPPNAVYNLSFNNFDGGSLAYSFNSDSWFATVSLIGGRHESEITIAGQPTPIELQSLVGVTSDVTINDWLSLRASYFQADVVVDAPALNPLLDALRGNGFANVASAIDSAGDPGTFLGFGAEINHGHWLLISEATFVEVDDAYFTDKEEFYVTAGYRFGKLTPTVTYGQRDGDAKLGILSGLPNVPQLAPLRDAVTGVLVLDDLDATYLSLGARWDVSNRIALKGDWTRYENKGPAAQESDAIALGIVFTF